VYDRLPPRVRRRLEEGGTETPKPGDAVFRRVENVIVGSNRLALRVAEREAAKLGYRTKVLTSELSGEARMVGADLVRRARRRRGRFCLLAGGETTVTVRGPGKGGRCQELALAAAIEMRGTGEMALLAAGTDGTDGPTDAAGAVVDGATATSDAALFLDANDSYSHFHAYGGHVMTGPTRTNVMDIVIVLGGS
jgi:glycerate-2-kinase